MYYSLAALTDEQAQAAANPTTSAAVQAVQGALQRGQLWLKPNSPNCTGSIKATGATITSTAGGVALKLAPAAGPFAPVVAVAAVVLDVFGAIMGHHAAAMAKEANILCAAVPAANDSLQAIDQAVRNGTVTPADGSQMLNQLYSSLAQAVQPILKDNSSQCNAACCVLAEARALIAQLQSVYADMPSTGGSGIPPSWMQDASQVVSTVSTSTGAPPAVIWMAGGLLLAKLLRLF